jgi:hypothetical protein
MKRNVHLKTSCVIICAAWFWFVVASFLVSFTSFAIHIYVYMDGWMDG